MKIASFNVNGIRAILSKNFQEWFLENDFDVLGLQEIKALQSDIKEHIEDWQKNYHVIVNSAFKKGYSGTMLFIKKTIPLVQIETQVNLKNPDDEGRIIIAHLDDLIICNGYFPNGQRDHSRVNYKLEFSKNVFDYMKNLNSKTKKNIIIMGDINTAHQEIDLANPKANSKTTGFLPNERKFIDDMIENGFVDMFRYFHPDLPEQYTWWTYRGDCRERNIGWRIDYFFSNNSLLSKVKNVYHQDEVKGSDHCPIVLELL